ncbi:MAG: NAD(P)-binding protein [Desulfovibrionaceae bacterium]|nr:NAD(P)-binding protein [Desulfovibrionaceae bacterium]
MASKKKKQKAKKGSTSKTVGSVMVVGGGIAGVQAALDLANSGYYVHLAEHSPAIGGVMAQLDKTFPTNDCSMCILSPKLVECGRHPNIILHTCTELESVTGEQGHFQITLRQKPRFISLDKCTGCGDCAEVCPVSVPSEFDQGLGSRKAIFKPYAQAIPGGYMIEKLDRSPCTNGCPGQVNAHAYVALIAQGKYREAMEVILRTLPFPGVIGRICPHPCETECRRGEVDAPVSICALKRFVADQVDIEELPLPEIEKRDEKVAIIGSGPAGLTAAYFLALDGYEVTVFEALPVAGGMLRVGIPDYRLPPEVLDKEIQAVTRLGVKIELNTALGRDVTVDGLFSESYKAIYLAIGAHKDLRLNIAGEDAEGAIPGVEFLRRVNLGELTKLSGRAVIVGGGDVAIDAARSALRLGAEKVTILYRRTRTEMPARENEVEDALAEGIEIQYLTAPNKIATKEDRVCGIECLRMELGEPDDSGRRRPIPVPGSEFILETEVVIPAIGQEPDGSFLAEEAELELSRRNTIVVDPVTYATSRDGVFAGGDAHTGPGIAIGAVAAGREAAVSISRYLQGEDLRAGREPGEIPQDNFRPIPEDIETRPRVEMPLVAMADRTKSFAEVELGLSEEQARAEAERCFDCMSCCECFECVAACKAEAVDHSMQEMEVKVEVGSIIAAPGFQAFDPSLYETYNYTTFPNVVTSMEFERILSASGPYQGHLVRPSDHKGPKKIAWLQCIGSRDINQCDHGYCSGVCCMYAIKEAVIAKEHSKEALDTAIFFMDMRTYGKDFDRYYNRAEEETGVRFIRSRVHSVERVAGTDDLELTYTTEEGTFETEIFDMVVLSVGMETSAPTLELAEKLGIDLDDDHFAATSSFAPVATSKPGIFVCGAFSGPKDIPYSVMEASAAAASSQAILASARGSLIREKTYEAERSIVDEEPRVGVFVCNCGVNIGGIVDVPAVSDYAKNLPFVVYVGENLFTCSQDTQEIMKEAIEEHRLNRVVVAACTPRTHEPLFQETIREVGLNRFLFEMANIRDQDSWVHQGEPEKATAKAKDLVRMAVAKASLLEPLEEIKVDLTPEALIIGGGVAGMVAALNLADQGFQTYLVEKTEQLGGHALKIKTTWKGEDVVSFVVDLIERIQGHENVEVLTNAEVKDVKGFVGNFVSTVVNGDGAREIAHGVAILATGAQAIEPDEYLYKTSDRVFRWHELEETIEANPAMAKQAKAAVFIQCVGSREPEHPYCSKICCTHSVQSALKLKEINPEMYVYVLYRDLRTYGPREDLYKEARQKGVIFIRYRLDDKPVVEEVIGEDGGKQLQVTVTDHILGRPITIKPDFINLATAIHPTDHEEVARLSKVPLNEDKFFLEAHMKLRPVDFATDGVFVCGLAHYPKPIEESIAQAQAAAGRAATVLSQKFVMVEPIVSAVDQDLCIGCGLCEASCAFSAIQLIKVEGKGYRAENISASCKGCGVCAAACPQQAIDMIHFRDRQIIAAIQAGGATE